MILLHWNALPLLILVYTYVSNHFVIKDHMKCMKLLLCLLPMPTLMKDWIVLMFSNVCISTLWFWIYFPKITSQSIWFSVIWNVQCMPRCSSSILFIEKKKKPLTFSLSINYAVHILPVCFRKDATFYLGLRLSNGKFIIQSWKKQLHIGLS